MTPAPYTTWRKHWPGSAHGQRYTYSILRVELTLAVGMPTKQLLLDGNDEGHIADIDWERCLVVDD